MLLTVLVWTCAEDETLPQTEKEGTLLNLSIGIASTRLSELPNPDAMSEDAKGLKNVGVYIYYTDDYNNNDLSKPYVRNMEFKVEGGRLLAVTPAGSDDSDQYIYIYANMTVVAFYPYNEEMNLPENYFTVKGDETKYPITRNFYEAQKYIPYRAQTTTDPTTAYYTILNFQPKHTYKLEVVVVAKDNSAAPLNNVELLSGNDPITNTDTVVDGKREKWYDNLNTLKNDNSGSDVRQYTAYIWTNDHNRNEIKKGDVLLKSDELTLIASQDLFPNEQRIYRYGYNMSTGEIFIPTSSNLVYDTKTLAAVDNTGGNFYQVCDIDVSKVNTNWTPITLLGGRYDGGGHAISNVTINNPAQKEVGLFGKVQGNAVLANVNLVNPKITVSTDDAFVGGLVGRLNTPMTEAEKEKLIGNLPDGLSDIVKAALIQEILATAGNSQADIVGSKVTNPTITVTGKAPIVGGLVGQAGEKTDGGNSKSRIWDSAVVDGSVHVNENDTASNVNAYIGGFIGLNQGYIGRTFTSTTDIVGNIAGVDEGGSVIPVVKAQGFGTMGTEFTADEGGLIESSYSGLADANSGVRQLGNEWPSWSTYTGIWPIDTSGWLSSPSGSFWYSNGVSPSTYPTLQWERR